MKIILINTGISGSGFNNYKKGMDQTWINHGLASIGAYLKKSGYDFDYLDLRRLRGWSHFRTLIARRSPDAVGISAMTVDYDTAVKCATLIKHINADTKIVIGGIHASLCADEVALDKNFDHVVTGEGEEVFPHILNGSIGSKKTTAVPINSLDSIPFIDRNIFGNIEYPIYTKLFPSPFATFIAARGCSYNCAFCQPAERILFGKKVRSRSVENLVGEVLKVRKDLNINSYLIHDDCLLSNIKWVEELIRQLEQNGLNLPFAIQSRADLICKNPDIIRRLSLQGLTMVLIGFESGSQRVLDFLKKGTRVEDNINAAKICQKNNVAIWANYMLGIPTETKSEALETISMVKKINPEVASPSFFTPYPGIGLFEYCKDNDLLLVKRSKDYRRNPYTPKIKGIDYAYLRKKLNESLYGSKMNYYISRAKSAIHRVLPNNSVFTK